MKNLAIKAENISKQYRLGEVGTGTLSHDLNRFWSKLRGKEDPYLQIGESNDRSSKGTSDYVWSLKDIDFEIQQGDAVGIVGKNGAGKSTLLKLLSKVTKPTTGNFKVNGRIASLLEVGTGFNPEMTGRENIYLNGAILGMRRSEINRKFDEIVDFSGVERYIDTPVKRYSSGMYVRLAFAVAAHLESEILIVDEVLAVGDAEFQKKCLGKMGDVSKGEGRTVLFVSHNMDAVRKLTDTCLVMEKGKLVYYGETESAIKNYMQNKNNIKVLQEWSSFEKAPGNEFVKLKKVSISGIDTVPRHEFYTTEDVYIDIEYWDFNTKFNSTAIIHLINENEQTLFASNEFSALNWNEVHDGKGIIKATCKIPSNFLADGDYSVFIAVGNYNPNMIHVRLDDALLFTVIDSLDLVNSVKKDTTGKWPGVIRPMLDWNISKI
jgi:lipopolysaccharide transport system ATP-binding protein